LSTAGVVRPRSIVVPLDGSESAEKVLPTVIRLAKRLGLEVFLIRAYGNPYSAFIGGSGPYAVNVNELVKDIRDEARNYLEGKMAEVQREGAEEISYLLQEGVAADEIVSVANQSPESLISCPLTDDRG
jgi:nucleotide-binding universal stress UspA family protein